MQDSLALELIKTLKNIQLKNGEDGKDGVCFPLNQMFSFIGDLEGNVYFYINEEGETTKKFLGNFKGLDGENGLSAYEIAVKNGFVGTEIEWLESFKGSSSSISSNLLPCAMAKFESKTDEIIINSSYGIKKIVRLSAGLYQVYFEKKMKDTNYIVMIGNAIVQTTWRNQGNDVYEYNLDSFKMEHLEDFSQRDTKGISFVVYSL